MDIDDAKATPKKTKTTNKFSALSDEGKEGEEMEIEELNDNEVQRGRRKQPSRATGGRNPPRGEEVRAKAHRQKGQSNPTKMIWSQLSRRRKRNRGSQFIGKGIRRLVAIALNRFARRRAGRGGRAANSPTITRASSSLSYPPPPPFNAPPT
jgi:hypothetical protein